MGEGIMVECVCHGCSTSLVMKDMRIRVVDNGRLRKRQHSFESAVI